MYIRIRKSYGSLDEKDTIISISKTTTIEELRCLIKDKLDIKPENQMLLYKGKELINDHRVMDYDIQLNDVIQLLIRSKQRLKVESSRTKSDSKVYKEVLQEAESEYYKVGDLIDVHLSDDGAWYEATIIKIMNVKHSEELIFKVKSAEHVMQFELDVMSEDIRPRSFHIYKINELKKGMTVLANYNIEEPRQRGYWYDFRVNSVSRNKIRGTVLLDNEQAPIRNCVLEFPEEIMRIEKPLPLDKQESRNIDYPRRKYLPNCDKCGDDINKTCQECGCRICAKKDNFDSMILCDECDFSYHLKCLEPPLQTIPEDDWYCPECKTDDTAIVRAGEKLKHIKKKPKNTKKEATAASSKYWGKGMACVGRTKECTIVPKDHYGPVPGIDVGTCWKFRVQVSEAGIHRPHVAGIHGRETDGAYSLVLSGGYEDDIDNGIEFYYTGSGGRDLSGNKRVSDQSCDQKLTRLNKALAMNCNAPFNDKEGADAAENWRQGKPVRVVRNYKLAKHSKYAPKDGNRYDGLYKVVKYYPERGKSGFVIWRYLLRRDDPCPAPWEPKGQEFETIYPAGYVEAQLAAAQENDAGSFRVKKKQRGTKRKSIDLWLKSGDANKKTKIEYILPDSVEKHIRNDTENQKLWTECRDALTEGKQKFLERIELVFMCICCQELLHRPITTVCKHNICQSCLERSFASEIYTCPYCRSDLDVNDSCFMKVNEHLAQALDILFPGYGNARK